MDDKIVTQASAGFCGVTADKVLNVDHHSICKFDTQFAGFMDVWKSLSKIREMLLSRRLGESYPAGKTIMVYHDQRNLMLILVCKDQNRLT